ncbi:MAG TPA: GNAT family N-acetyltransferase [Candidatus Xenobia bacterium]
MSYQVRPGRPSDIDDIITICRRRPAHQVVFHGVPAEERIEHRIESYRESTATIGSEPKIPVFVAERHGRAAGYMALVLGTWESITNEKQAVVYDFGLPVDDAAGCFAALMAAATAAAREAGEQYMIVNLPEIPAEEQLFSDRGFVVDMVRIGKRVTPVPPPGMNATGFRVRPGGPNDKLFVLNLNTMAAPFTIPPYRDRDELAIGQMYWEAYAELDLSPDNPLLRLFVVEDVATGAPVGQIMIKLGIRDLDQIPVGYIYDIAVHPDHMGHHLALNLVHEAELFLHRGGIHWLTGDISAANPRPLTLSLKYLGFSIQYRRWARAVPGG